MTRPTHGILHAHPLQFLHDLRQHGIGGRGREHDGQLFAQVSEEFEDVDPGERHHAAEHAQHEDADRDVEQHHQRNELLQRADAVFADGIGDRAEHAERRDPHDQPHDPEQHGGGRVDDRCDQRALLATDERKADTEQDREEQHLEHVVARQRAAFVGCQ